MCVSSILNYLFSFLFFEETKSSNFMHFFIKKGKTQSRREEIIWSYSNFLLILSHACETQRKTVGRQREKERVIEMELQEVFSQQEKEKKLQFLYKLLYFLLSTATMNLFFPFSWTLFVCLLKMITFWNKIETKLFNLFKYNSTCMGVRYYFM